MKQVICSLFLLLVTGHFAKGETDKYRAIWRSDPATEITIGWNQINGKNATLYYGTEDHGSDFQEYEFSASVTREVSYKWMENKFVRLSNLIPNTVYYFVLVDLNSTSRRLSFKTASNNPEDPISIIAGGDSRNNQEVRRSANLLVSKLRPDCVMFGGDYTALGMFYEWKTWLDDWQLTITQDGHMTPIVATRGNHESKNEDIYHLFDVPSAEVYYSLEVGVGLLKMYTLNSEISIAGNQSEWLLKELERNKNFRFSIAQYHRPMRPHVSFKSEQQLMYQKWAMPFYEHRLDLVVECDAHTVKTTYPLQPNDSGEEGFTREDENGTTYVGEGCWGAPLRNNDDSKSWTRASGMFHQFKWIFVYPDRMEVRTIMTENAEEVGYLGSFNRFTYPENLQVWEPPTGAVITIFPKDKTSLR